MSKLSLADKLAKIDELVEWFNSGDFDIDEALKKFDKLVALSDEVKTDLDKIDNRIKVLEKKFSE